MAGSLVLTAASRDLRAGSPVVFANLVGYDLVAHETGARSPTAFRSIGAMDDVVGKLITVVGSSPRRYRVVLVSDHGVASADPAPSAFAPDPRAWVASEWRRRRRVDSPRHLSLAAHGTLLQAWITGGTTRIPIEEIDRMAPGYVAAIARHPAIAMVVTSGARQPDGTPTVFVAAAGGALRLCAGSGAGSRPVVVGSGGESNAPPGVSGETLGDVVAFGSRPDAGDIACIAAPSCRHLGPASSYWSYEDQAGAHGGIGGEQGRPFVIAPPECDPPPPDGAGAGDIHEWLESLRPTA